MRPLTLEQKLERSVFHARAKRLERDESDLAEWLAAMPEPENNMSTAIQKTEPDHAPVRYIERDELASWRAMREQASELVKSGFLPRAVNTPEKAMAIIQTGKELGLGPMQALRSIHIIEGKPTMSADLIAGLALAKLPGSVLRVSESSDKQCVIEAGRAGQKLTSFTYTMTDAQRAGLAGKDNWKKHPRAMLRARAITEAARAIFPDTCVGLYDPDELGAVTGPSGEVVELPRVVEVTPLSPHRGPADSDDDNKEDGAVVEYLTQILENVKQDAAHHCTSYDKALSLRHILGTRAKQSALTSRIQQAGENGEIGPDTKAALGKLWMHCDRQVTKLEKQLAPGPEDALAGDDEPDGTEALSPERKPGEDDD
jgi:hypothetical protein